MWNIICSLIFMILKLLLNSLICVKEIGKSKLREIFSHTAKEILLSSFLLSLQGKDRSTNIY